MSSHALEESYQLDTQPFVQTSVLKVFRCKDLQNGGICAAKVYDKRKITTRRAELVNAEINVGHSIPPHQNVVRVHGGFEDDLRLTVVMDYMPAGNLFQYLMTNGAMREAKAANVLRQILSGLAHMHGCGIMHRDIKPENVFFRQLGNKTATTDSIAIGDFGFATNIIPNDQYVGSPQYSAPELALIAIQYQQHSRSAQKGLYNEKCDIWSVGIVAFVMLSALLPFDGVGPDAVFAEVVRGALPYHKARTITPRARQFIELLTQANPSKRPSAKEALRHPWLSSFL